ncbi:MULTISPECIES: PH domain-containing protein [unclassified Streptomyces]|uniref:PH domain-containing protein n=1 Tax=unclassified Streptomyces TaxID=2593676 RepID=UPI0022514D65|nr:MULTISPECIES: PH domain-containing protein [unclassified Streptomyces]MCX5151317.1 PH domain-containing protein [Streptomyces sp. NBC_00320]WSN48370.1 PH domain-containing protein [Streptomyces sp. NBC_01296]WSW62218.1 PH domain-containing protein [Streptomyces sp. NBC_00998]
MPLPFLTADRAFDAHEDTADEDVLAHEDPDRWRRPYRPGPWRVAGAALLLLLAAFMLLATMIIAFAGAWAGAGVCVAAALGVIGSALRLLMAGVWVSPAGLRRVGFFRTRSIGWDEITEVRTVQQPVRWLGLPRTVQGQALTAAARDGAELPVLLTDHNADFLSRTEAFDRAADMVEAWADEYRAVPA